MLSLKPMTNFSENLIDKIYKEFKLLFLLFLGCFFRVYLSLINLFSFGKEKIAEECRVDGLIVSLTSIPSRFDKLHLVLESLCRQSIRPQKIVLWLSNEHRNKEFEYLRENEIPKKILDFKSRGVEIIFTDDIGSFRKIIPALKAYPECSIVTVDDDIIYKKNMLKILVDAHYKEPRAIVCLRSRTIKKLSSSELLDYSKWKLNDNQKKKGLNIFFNTGAGTLFPPRIFSSEVLNTEAFLRLSPFSDDIWLNSMRILNNVETLSLGNRQYFFLQQKSPNALSEINWNNSYNNKQLKKVFSEYSLYEKI